MQALRVIARLMIAWVAAGAILLGLTTPARAAAPSPAPESRCGDPLESRVWALWDREGQTFIAREMVQRRALADGDAYALYDLQGYLRALADMAMRCKRGERLAALAAMLLPVLDAQVGLPDGGKGWICRGGRVCNDVNKLKGKEVVLDSLQFLALASRIAGRLGESPEEKVFTERVVATMVDHLVRLEHSAAVKTLPERTEAAPSLIKDGSSRLVITDLDLWAIDLYAELAGLIARRPELVAYLPDGWLTSGARASVSGFLRLMRGRLSLQPVKLPGGATALGGDLDRGFWRLHADSRYAGYVGDSPPANCSPGQSAKLHLPADQVPLVETLGWDFSHARRLVTALDAVEQRRDAMLKAYRLPPGDLPAAGLPQAFAVQLLGVLWNHDSTYPLFTNFWDGSNGWYRVAYDNGTGACRSGTPPWGLTDSFATGGFIAWGRYQPPLSELGIQIYRLSQTADQQATAFITKNYSQLGSQASSNNRMLTQLMFWPNLVLWSKAS